MLALELLKILLENSGPTFRNSDKFITAIRNYLCLSLLKNSASSLPQVRSLHEEFLRQAAAGTEGTKLVDTRMSQDLIPRTL